MADEFDPFKPDPGLPDNIDLTVTGGEFGWHDKYGDSLVFTLRGDTMGEDGPGETDILYSAGKGWEPFDDGKGMRREDGRKRGINKGSGYWKLIEAAMKCGAEDEMRQRAAAGADPFRADMWVGLKFHMERFSEEWEDRNDRDDDGKPKKKETTRLLPVSFLGVVGDGTTTATPAATTPAAATNGAGGAPKKLIEMKLKALAKEKGTFDEFMEAGFNLPGVNGDPELEALVISQEFWATARA